MKIQLDAEAINAILSCRGDDYKLELQQSIVNEFGKKYLKGVVAEPQIKQLQKGVTDYISEQFGTSNGSYYNAQVNLNEKTKKAIQKYIDENFDRYVRENINKNEDWNKFVEAAITRAFNNIDFGEYIQKVYDKQLNETIKTKIQEKIKDQLKNLDLTTLL